MKKLNSKESGLCIIPDNNDKSTIFDDGLHAFVCPHCSNTIIDGKDIVCYEGAKDDHRFSCWGGFGIEKYTWIPHKCTACGTKFLAWTAEKKVHGPVIGYFIGMMIGAALACIDIACAIAIKPELALFLMVPIPIIICCLIDIDEETFYKTDNPMKEMIDRACFPTDEEEEPEDTAQELSDRIDDSLHSLASYEIWNTTDGAEEGTLLWCIKELDNMFDINISIDKRDEAIKQRTLKVLYTLIDIYESSSNDASYTYACAVTPEEAARAMGFSTYLRTQPNEEEKE